MGYAEVGVNQTSVQAVPEPGNAAPHTNSATLEGDTQARSSYPTVPAADPSYPAVHMPNYPPVHTTAFAPPPHPEPPGQLFYPTLAQDHENFDPSQQTTGTATLESINAGIAPGDLYLYVLPLFKDAFVYLPVGPPRPERTGWQRGVSDKAKNLKEKMSGQWNKLGEAGEDTFKRKIYRFGNKHFEDVSPEDRLVQNMPRHVSRVRVFHPAHLSPDDVISEMESIAAKQKKGQLLRAVGTGMLTPFAQLIDFFVIPGPGILTALCIWKTYGHARSAVGSRRALNLTEQAREKVAAGVGVVEETKGGVEAPPAGPAPSEPLQESLLGKSGQQASEAHAQPSIDFQFVPEQVLDEYVVAVQRSAEGFLNEEQVQELAHKLQQPALVKPLLMLRRRRLRALGLYVD